MKAVLESFDQTKRFPLPDFNAFSLLWEADAPAASFEGTFPFFSVPKGLQTPFLRLSEWGETRFFGPVDVLTETAGKTASCKVEARSLPALLLDSEAVPATYRDPDLETLFARHAAPYGFSKIVGEKRSVAGTYSVLKGASEWAALEGFCKRCLGVPLYAVGDTLYAGNYPKKAPLRLGRNGVPVCAASKVVSPSYALSEVWGKTGDMWEKSIEDKDLLSCGIRRRRLSQDPSKTYASARKNVWRLTVMVPGFLPAVCGENAVFSRAAGQAETGVIQSILWSRSDSGETTRLVLQKADGFSKSAAS